MRNRARELRSQGWALRRIAHELGVALSTVSVWVRDVSPSVPVESAPPASDATPDRDAESALDRRRCGHCQRDLPLTSFNRHPTGYQWWCRDCYRAYFRNRAKLHRRQVHEARRRRRQEARAFISDYLGVRQCVDCGEADPRVLEFHHLARKRANVTDMVRAGSSLGALERELVGCAVLCVNCHRVRTAAERASWRREPASMDPNPHLTPGEWRNVTYLRALLLRSCCIDCGDSRLEVLDFDHVGAKTACVVDLARRGCSLQRLQDEVSRCELRCANCHRRRHAEVREEAA